LWCYSLSDLGSSGAPVLTPPIPSMIGFAYGVWVASSDSLAWRYLETLGGYKITPGARNEDRWQASRRTGPASLTSRKLHYVRYRPKAKERRHQVQQAAWHASLTRW